MFTLRYTLYLGTEWCSFDHSLNVHLVGVVVMLAGVFGLLLSLLVWGPLSRRGSHSGGYGRGALPLAWRRSIYQDPAASCAIPAGSQHDRPGGPSKVAPNRWLKELASLPQTASPSVSGSGVVCRSGTPNSLA
jgi:hypothetical protein